MRWSMCENKAWVIYILFCQRTFTDLVNSQHLSNPTKIFVSYLSMPLWLEEYSEG